MATVLSPPEQRVILHNVSWETYGRLVSDLMDGSAPRLTYDRGTLEIISPSSEHERFNRALARIVEELAETLDVDLESLGSTTFRSEEIDRGFEPDSCFYIKNAIRVRGKKRLDLTVDPPPDLVIEIDISRPSLDKFPIFAEVEVPEVWRFDGDRLAIYVLDQGTYEERATSLAFPNAGASEVTTLTIESETLVRPDWISKVRSWVAEQK